jgi:multicomponent K+:H+ antiporter subunit E
MMKSIPPLLTLLLVVIWLLLNGSLSPGHIVLGAVFAVFLMLAAAKLRPIRPRLSRLYLVVPLVLVVLVDILRSNLGVARIVLGLVKDRKIRSGFLDIPLDMRDPHGLAMLSAIVTSTPGTTWAGLSPDGRWLKLHILDLKDEEEWIHIIKDRYERPLMRIFE